MRNSTDKAKCPDANRRGGGWERICAVKRPDSYWSPWPGGKKSWKNIVLLTTSCNEDGIEFLVSPLDIFFFRYLI